MGRMPDANHLAHAEKLEFEPFSPPSAVEVDPLSTGAAPELPRRRR